MPLFCQKTLTTSPYYSWSTYHDSNGYESNSQNAEPLFINAGVDFTLQPLSPAIDAGTDVGLLSDYLGNPIYGTPDIGAYEYQPPYTMGIDAVDTAGDIRIYADGKFRNTHAASGITADFTVTPAGGFGTGDYSEWMNIDITAWNTSGTYKKTWTETSASIGSAATVHTIGDLQANKEYWIKVNHSFGANISGRSCSGNICTASANGKVVFTYTGGYSAVTFELEEVLFPFRIYIPLVIK